MGSSCGSTSPGRGRIRLAFVAFRLTLVMLLLSPRTSEGVDAEGVVAIVVVGGGVGEGVVVVVVAWVRRGAKLTDRCFASVGVVAVVVMVAPSRSGEGCRKLLDVRRGELDRDCLHDDTRFMGASAGCNTGSGDDGEESEERGTTTVLRPRRRVVVVLLLVVAVAGLVCFLLLLLLSGWLCPRLLFVLVRS